MTAAAEKLQGAALRVYLVLFAGRDRAGLVCRTYGDVGKQLGMSWSTVARAHADLQEMGLISRHSETARATQYQVRDAAALGGEEPERPENLESQRPVLHNLSSYGIPAISSTRDTSPNAAISITGAIGRDQVRNAGAHAGAPARAPTSPTKSTASSLVSRVPNSLPPSFSGARCAHGGGPVTGDTSPGGREGASLSPGDLEARKAELSWVALPAVREELAHAHTVARIKATKAAVLKLARVSDRGATLVRMLRKGGVEPAAARTSPAPAPAPKPAPAPAEDTMSVARLALMEALEALSAEDRARLDADPAWSSADDAKRATHPLVRPGFRAAMMRGGTR